MSTADIAREQPVPERRACPRIPTDLGVVVESPGRKVIGVTVDASAEGLQLSLREACLEVDMPVAVRLNLPDAGWYRIEGTVVRHESQEEGALVGIRLDSESGAPSEPAGPPTTADGRGRRRRVRKSRARPRPRAPRPPPVVLAELRALGGFVYEQAILGDQEAPGQAHIAWAERLAEELGAPPPRAVDSHHALIHELAGLHRHVRERELAATVEA